MDSGMFAIRYVKLHFTIRFPEACTMPKYKASALRGGMGEMLLRANCIRDRDCEKCDFESECIVRRILYSKMEIQPAFMTKGDSVGYVLECENYQTAFGAGEELQFNLILFGKAIVYFSQILNAFYALGQCGVGKDHSRYEIAQITNTKGDPILHGNDVQMARYEVSRLHEYTTFRKKQLEQTGMEGRIRFKTPLTLKYQGEFLKKFQIRPILESIRRRIYMLNCFEGIADDIEAWEPDAVPIQRSSEQRMIEVPRYSSHQNSRMVLRGIEGELELENVAPEALELLLAGELVHIGKNTSFGFGRYRVK